VSLGRPERAVVLAGAAARLRESIGGGLTVESSRWETEHPRDAARRFLSDTQIDRAWARGRTHEPGGRRRLRPLMIQSPDHP
jgi:hypothetical protein